jgi:hypothetical protein
MPQTAFRSGRSLIAAAVVVAAAAATSGCAYTMSDFDRGASANATPADVTTTGALPMKPATYVVDSTDAPQAATATPPVSPAPATTASYPNLNQIPAEPKSQLLSPDQKAKVISELEALAKSQEAAVDKVRKDAASACEAAVKNALNPEAKLKSEAAGQGC